MSSWIDYLSLAIFLALLGGLGFVAIALKRWFSNITQAARDCLEKHGIYMTSHGVTFRMNKTYDHEQYIDDTRTTLVSIIKASSFGTNENKQSLSDLITFREVPRVKKATLLPASSP